MRQTFVLLIVSVLFVSCAHDKPIYPVIPTAPFETSSQAIDSEDCRLEPGYQTSWVGTLVSLERTPFSEAKLATVRALTEDCVDELFWIREGDNGNLWLMCDDYKLTNRYGLALDDVPVPRKVELRPGDWLKVLGTREECEEGRQYGTAGGPARMKSRSQAGQRHDD